MGEATGYGSPIIGGLGALIRDWIRSRNYVPGVSGWQINADGDAEFNDVVIRGEVDIGGAPGPEVKIYNDPSTGPGIFLYTHGPGETKPGSILAAFTATFAELATFIYSPEHNSDGQINLSLVGPESPATNTFYPSTVDGGRFGFNNPSPGTAIAAFSDATGIFVDDISLDPVGLGTSLIVPLQLGRWIASNLRLDSNGIQSSNNGAAADLFINNAGGKVWFGSAADVAGVLSANNLRRGTATTPAPGGVAPFVSSVAVNFASVMPGAPSVIVTPRSAVGAITAWSATAVTTSGFTLNSNRTNNQPTDFYYFAISSI